jgi:probable F420-dependent oxidoreductase
MSATFPSRRPKVPPTIEERTVEAGVLFMQVSVTISGLSRLFGDDLGAVVDVAHVADEAGIHQLVIPDHLAIGPRTDRYPFGSAFPYPPEEPWLEPLTVLAAFAAVTRRVRLGTGVLITPVRSALAVAKTVATLDVLSRGRLDLGVGTGWQREEYTEPGLPFVGRTARMDDAVRAWRALWEQEPPVSFDSPSISFADLWCEPRPDQARLPVWFSGGANEHTVRRVAELGDGWLPLAIPLDDVTATIEKLRVAFRDRGRDPSLLGVRQGIAVKTDGEGRVDLDATVAPVADLAARGITAVSVALGRFLRTRADVEPFLRDLGAAFG